MAFLRVLQWVNTEMGKNYRPLSLWVQSFRESIPYPYGIDASHEVRPNPDPAENSAQFSSHLSRKCTIPEVLAPVPCQE